MGCMKMRPHCPVVIGSGLGMPTTYGIEPRSQDPPGNFCFSAAPREQCLLISSPLRGHNYNIIQTLIHRENSLMKWATEGHPPALLPTRLWNRKERTWD